MAVFLCNRRYVVNLLTKKLPRFR